MTNQQIGAQEVRQAQIATSICFFVYGLGFGLWVVHIPSVVTRLSIEPATLGLILLSAGLGAAVSQPFAAGLVARLGSRRATFLLQPLMMVIIPLAVIAPSIPILFALAILLGFTGGPFNVAINTQAAHVEGRAKRPIMSSFHGFFSLGGLTSAGVGAFILHIGWGDGRGIAIATGLGLIVSVIAARGMLAQRTHSKVEGQKPGLMLPSLAVVGVAVLAFFGNMVEGTVQEWSGLYLREGKGASDTMATLGFAMYSVSMVIMRFLGGSLATKLGDRTVLTGGGILIAVGFLVAVTAPVVWIAALGFLIVGLGAANTYPLVMAAASRVPGVEPSVGVASVATAGLLGYLTGPPLIGFISQTQGFAFGLGFVALNGLVIALGANTKSWRRKPIGEVEVVTEAA